MVTINEKCTSRLTITFKDETGALITPITASMKIIDVKSGTIIRAATAFTPTSSSHNMYITPEENRIISTKNVTELRRAYVSFTYSATKYGNSEYEYTIKNLGGVT